jgi:hypothetical protein
VFEAPMVSPVMHRENSRCRLVGRRWRGDRLGEHAAGYDGRPDFFAGFGGCHPRSFTASS